MNFLQDAHIQALVKHNNLTDPNIVLGFRSERTGYRMEAD